MTTSSFDDRQKAFENKFKLDEEVRFKIQSKAVKLFGHWAADQLGLKGADAEAYANQVVDSDFEKPGVDDVLEKVLGDFAEKGVETTKHHLENQFLTHLEDARKAVMG